MMNPSRIAMSRPLNVPTGGRSMRTRRKYSSAPALTANAPTRVTPSSMRFCCRREIGWVCGTREIGMPYEPVMSCSNERLLAGERGFVQVASGVAQRGGLVVADDRQVHVQARVGEVTAGRGVAVGGGRGGGERGLDPAPLGGGAAAGGARGGGQGPDGPAAPGGR